MTHYVVTWTIDIDADTPHQAAELARAAQTVGTEALVFAVFTAAAPDGPPVKST